MGKITELKARLYDLSIQHSQLIAQAQQAQAQAQQQAQAIERDVLKLQGQLEQLQTTGTPDNG